MRGRVWLACVVLVPIVWASAGAIEPGQAMVVAFHIRASGRDAITVCQEQGLDQTEAASLGSKVADALALAGFETIHARDEQCLALRIRGPLTSPGARNERIARIDATRLIEMRRSLGYRELFVVVCTPHLTDRLTIRRGGGPAGARGCETGGYQWAAGDGLDLDVSVRVTGTDVARGIVATASWWLGLLTAGSIAFAFFGKRYRWSFLRRHSALAGALVSVIGLVAAYGWIQVAYRSHLVHALQVIAAIDVGGEIALVAIPAALAFVTVAGACSHIAHDAARLSGPPVGATGEPGGFTGVASLPVAGVIPEYLPPAQRAPHAVMWAYAPAISLAVAFLILWTAPADAEIKIEGMLAASVAFALAVPAFTSGILPSVFGAVRLEPGNEQLVLEDARLSGARVSQVWSSPVAPAAMPLGGAIVLAGKRAIVWEPLTGLPPRQLAAAIALRGARIRGWPMAIGGSVLALLTFLLTRAEGAAPAPVVLAFVGSMCIIALLDLMEHIRVRTAERSGSRTEEHIRGLLVAARAHARLAASGSLTPAEVLLPGLAISVWERALRLARRIADDSGIDPQFVDTTAAQILASEVPQPQFLPRSAPLPEPPPPLPAPVPKRHAPPKKKRAAASRKKVAARSKPTRRGASARSVRRSRP